MGILPGSGKVLGTYVFTLIAVLAAFFAMVLTLVLTGFPSRIEVSMILLIVSFIALLLVMFAGTVILRR